VTQSLAEPLIVTVVSSGRRAARPRRGSSARTLGWFTLAACVAWTYLTWWPADRYLLKVKLDFILDQGVALQAAEMAIQGETHPIEAIAQTLFGTQLDGAASRPAESTTRPGMTVEMGRELKLKVIRQGTAFFGSLFAWYALMGTAGCLMAAAAGASIVGRFPGRRARLRGLALWIAALLGVIGLALVVYQRHGLVFPVYLPRYVVLLLTVACLGLGTLISSGGRWFLGAATFTALLAGVGTLAAIYVAVAYAELRDPVINPGLYPKVAILLAYPLVTYLGLRATRAK